jgi:large subunit ribosomal protein L35
MPKMKTHKAGAKRYKVTGSGKILRNQAGRSHLNVSKAPKRKRRLDAIMNLSTADTPRVLAELPYLKHARS